VSARSFCDFVNVVLLLNGTYDILCAVCILWLPASRLGRLHLSVFKSTPSALSHRIFAYWVLTYGLDRLVAGACASRGTHAVAVLSYLMESATYYNEASHASVNADKARFVYLLCLFLASLVALGMAVA
jgi:hypothetical protein